MKTYTIPKLKILSSEQGYKMAALENSQGERIVSFNKVTSKINPQLDLIKKRLDNEINPDGIYYVLLAHSINKSKAPDRYPIAKGKVSASDLQESEKKTIPLTPTVIVEKSEHVLSWENAVAMNKRISDLESEVKLLQMEKEALENEVAELKSELNEASLAEGQGSTVSFLKETVPSLLPALDRYFNLEEQKLELKKMAMLKGAQPKQVKKVVKDSPQTQNKASGTQIGTQEHLNYIEQLFNAGDDEGYNAEMDKLQAVNPDLHDAVVQQLEGEEDTDE